MMDDIVKFLQGIHLNDNKEWYFENSRYYVSAFHSNAIYIQDLIDMIGKFDITIKYLTLSDCSYPLWRHPKQKIDDRIFNDFLGGYFARLGKRSGFGGYYYQISPDPSDSGGSLLAVGIFNPSRELLDRFRRDAQQNGAHIMELINATGFELLERDRFQRIPKGFSIEPEYRDLLLQRHIMLVKRVGLKWFYNKNWMERTAREFRRCKPFLDYINTIVERHIREERNVERRIRELSDTRADGNCRGN